MYEQRNIQKLLDSKFLFDNILGCRGWGDTHMSSPLGESTLATDAKTAIKMVRDNLGDSAKVRLTFLLH